MVANWITQAKLMPPEPSSGWIARELLPKDSALPPVTVLSAAPGFGKTLGLRALLGKLDAPGVVTLWYTLDPYDADVVTFFHYLVAGMQVHIPDFGKEILSMLAVPAPDARALWLQFFRSVASYNLTALRLVLDDFHHLMDGEMPLVRALGYCFDKLPPQVHVLIATRKRLPLPVARLQARGMLMVLDHSRLRFSADEQEAILEARAAGKEIPAAWRDRLAPLDGWPLGVDLALGPWHERAHTSAGSTQDLVAAFVAEEWLEAQEPRHRDFLLRVALLKEITPEACGAWGYSPQEALALLDALAELHLLQPLATPAAYRLPAFLQDHLRQEAERRLPATALEDFHVRAAAHWLEADAPESAIPHWLAAGRPAEALAACLSVFPWMRASGRRAQIERLIHMFPAARQKDEPWLLWWRGVCRADENQPAEALALYEAARAGFLARGDRPGAFKALVSLCNMHQVRGADAALSPLLAAAEDERSEGRAEDVADFLLHQALAAEQAGDLARMQALNEEVLALAIHDNLDVANCHCVALMNLYTAALHAGDLEQAWRHVTRFLELARAWDFYPFVLYGSFMESHLHLVQGHPDKAAPFLRALPEGWMEALHWHDLACAHAIIGHFHQRLGELDAAEAALNRSFAVFERAGFAEGMKVPLERLLWLVIQRRLSARTGALLARVGPLDSRHVYDLALLVPHARARHLEGAHAEARDMFQQVLPQLEAQGAWLHLARAALYAAAAQAVLGDRAAAQATFERAEALIAQHGYAFLRGEDRQLWEELALVTAPIPPEAPTPLPTAAPAPSLERVVPASPLALCCFGSFEVRLDGVRLDQWPRKKSRLVLAALALYPEGLSPLELAGLLAEHGANAVNTMQVNLAALRRVLEPKLSKGGASRYIHLVGERYVLAPEAIASLDLRQFESAVAAARAATEPEAIATAYRQALDVYRGNLLQEPAFAGIFEAERERYRQMALKALLWLGRYYGGLEAHTLALECLERAIELAPCEEDLYLDRMDALLRQGRPEKARQAYWDCRRALKANGILTPSPEFEAAAAERFASPDARQRTDRLTRA